MQSIAQIPLLKKVAGFINRLSNGRWEIVPDQNADDLYAAIYQLEKTLSEAPTRPMQARSIHTLGPITERQKIMDLSG